MSAAAPTKIFGIKVGLDPKILVFALVAFAALLFWYNSRGDDSPAGASTPTPVADPGTATPALAGRPHAQGQHRRASHDDHGTLKLRAVDPTRGDIDPVLRLDLLDRLTKIQAPSGVRNLFESGPAVAQGADAMPNRVIQVKPLMPVAPVIAAAPLNVTPTQANIPLKYYGFAKPVYAGDANRGFFMDGDSILVAVEGQLLQQRYLVVQLSPTSARLEDTQVKLGQTLPVVPEALEPGGTGAINQPAMNQPEPNGAGFNQAGVNRPGLYPRGLNPANPSQSADEVNQ